MPWFDRRTAIERLYGTPVVLGGRGAKAAFRRFALILVTVIAVLVGLTLFFGLVFD
jgi:hypothetical protein